MRHCTSPPSDDPSRFPMQETQLPIASMGRHTGRVAVVTGAARGLGRSFALRLAGEGAHVVVADIRDTTETVDLLRQHGRAPLGLHCDVSSEEDVAALADAVIGRFGRCDILVNNAGIFRPAPFEELTLAQWRATLAVNLDAMFLTCRALVPHMRRRGWGRIVNIASNAYGLVLEHCAPFVASTAGVIGLTRVLATELGPAGITANAVLPGLTRTEATELAARDGAVSFDDMVARQAVPRAGEVQDLAGIVCFLSSEDSSFMTGQSVVVDGGLVRH